MNSIKYDENGNRPNRMQVIRKMDKLRIAMLLELIVNNLGDYPCTREEWLTWLNEPASNSIDKF
jgi:hypothetical protein